nr:hypothetical protein DA06_04025 [Georgenia sp. SUBG003]
MLDAKSIRRWSDGEAAVDARLAEGTVRRAVFLDFGTNAGIEDEAVVRRVMDKLGPQRMVVVVNLYGGSDWIPEANATLADIVSEYPNAIVADWHAAISRQPELLQSDRIHPGIEGAHLYAEVLESAFAALSERLTGSPVLFADRIGAGLGGAVAAGAGLGAGAADDATTDDAATDDASDGAADAASRRRGRRGRNRHGGSRRRRGRRCRGGARRRAVTHA